MTTMKIWYAPRSSAFRTLWCLEEIGEPYERVRVDLSKGETRTPEFKKLNPNGKIPTFQDGEILLWESMAINDYLAGKFPQANLLPAEPARARAEVLKWMHWGLVSLYPLVHAITYNRLFRREEARIEAAAAAAASDIRAPLAVLNESLADLEYVAGAFSLADFAYANLRSLPRCGVSFAEVPRVETYLGRLEARPAYGRARAIE